MAPRPPRVTLGRVAPNGVSPSLCALVELGARKRPELARKLAGVVEIRFREDFAPVLVRFGKEGVVVEDRQAGSERADVVVSGSMSDISQVAAAPLAGGLPKLTDRRGRAAIARMAGRKVRIQGRRGLARQLMRLLEL